MSAAGSPSRVDFEALVQKLDATIDEHGEIRTVEEREVGRSGNRVHKMPIFSDGHHETLLIEKVTRREVTVQWDGTTYILDKTSEVFTGSFEIDALDASQNDASTSSINPPNEGNEWRTVDIGSNEYWTTETHSRARTKNDWMGQSKATTSGTECQVATEATFLGIPGAYAQTWVSFTVDSPYGEPDDKHADFQIDTSRAVSWMCATVPGSGAGSGGWKVGAYVYDYEASSFIDKEKIAEGWLGLLAFTTAASIIPLVLRAFPTTYSRVFMRVLLGVLIPAVVLAVARDVDFDTGDLGRVYKVFVVLMAIGFGVVPLATPPDPATMLLPVLATFGVALAVSLGVVATVIDHRIVNRV